MVRSCCALAVLFSCAVGAAEFKGVSYSLPQGWAMEEQGGNLLLAPPGVDESNAVIIVVFGAGPLGSEQFRDWLERRMADNLHSQARILEQSGVQGQKMGSLMRLTNTRAVRDAEGAVRYQMFNAVSDGRFAGLAMAVATSQDVVNQHADGLRSFFGSMRLSTAAATAPPPAAQPAPAPGRTVQAGLPAGTYHCLSSRWSPNQGILYEPSILGRLILDGRGTYQVSATGNTGSYRVSGGSFAFSSGPLAGWPALVETVENRPRIRLGKSKDNAPNPAGPAFGEHRCTWRE
jgi:hypothetical protein